MPGRVCKHCGAALRRKAKAGPWPTYCSGSCRALACTARAAADGRKAQWVAAKNARRREVSKADRVSRYCDQCAVWFTPLRRKDMRYCSAVCANRAFRRRRTSTPEGQARLTAYQQTRRARKKGDADAQPFDARDIFERDGWICGLCHEPIPKDAPPRDPMSASLDHVVPLSLGGAHTPENTQAAHLVCNGRKGNRTAA